jgi:hypothetical protein
MEAIQNTSTCANYIVKATYYSIVFIKCHSIEPELDKLEINRRCIAYANMMCREPFNVSVRAENPINIRIIGTNLHKFASAGQLRSLVCFM